MIISKFPPPTAGEKADGFIKLSDESILLPNTIGETASFTFVKLGDGEVTAESSNENVCTVSISGNTVALTVTGSGSSDITLTVAESITNKKAEAVCSCASADPILANNSPATIKSVADSGTASSIWNVGDKTSLISINAFSSVSATSACAFIIGFDHNSAYEGTGIHFQFGKTSTGTNIAFIDGQYNGSASSGLVFNSSSTNVGGWSSSYMRNTVCSSFFNALPSEWKNVISDSIKYTDNSGNSSTSAANVTATTDKIFVLAEYEVFGSNSQGNVNEATKQKQYQFYANGNSTLKYRHTATSSGAYWYMRTPNKGSSTWFSCVGEDGTEKGGTGWSCAYSYGFAPGFKVGGAAA